MTTKEHVGLFLTGGQRHLWLRQSQVKKTPPEEDNDVTATLLDQFSQHDDKENSSFIVSQKGSQGP